MKKPTWWVAPALRVLAREIDAEAPTRSKASDGTIGDAAHAKTTSDHNPCACCRLVLAMDFTHDPGGGLDAGALATWLAERAIAGDPRIRYLIWKRKIASGPAQGHAVGVWRPYKGADPHTTHLHVSVRHVEARSTASWGWPPRGEIEPSP